MKKYMNSQKTSKSGNWIRAWRSNPIHVPWCTFFDHFSCENGWNICHRHLNSCIFSSPKHIFHDVLVWRNGKRTKRPRFGYDCGLNGDYYDRNLGLIFGVPGNLWVDEV